MEDKFPKYTKMFWKYWWVWSPILLIIIILASSGGNNQNTNSPDTKKEEVVSQTPEQKEAAQKELNEVIDLATKAGLVKSYEFSDKASIVYAGPVWYTQTVAFKKDFLAKVATLKKSITGYSHFEVHDAYSNEKVGEVTAFSQSLEVYK